METWFASLALTLPTVPAPPSRPKIISTPEYDIELYDRDQCCVLAVRRRSQATAPTADNVVRYDFRAFHDAPVNPESAFGPFVQMEIAWAWIDGGILFVSHHHRTYASASHGRNAHVTAVRLQDGEVLWRSPPLVSNANNFVVLEEVLLTGYGFTDEDDYLYVLDRSNGSVVSRTQVASGPDFLVLKNGNLYVRTYNRDYVFTVQH